MTELCGLLYCRPVPYLLHSCQIARLQPSYNLGRSGKVQPEDVCADIQRKLISVSFSSSLHISLSESTDGGSLPNPVNIVGLEMLLPGIIHVLN